MENFRTELRRQGHIVAWFSTRASSANTPLADHLCYGTTTLFRGLLQLANPAAAHALRRVIEDFRPDVVHVAMFLTQLSSAILPVLADVPALYHVQWYRPICLTGTRVLPGGQACQQRAGIACLRSGCLPLHDWVPLVAGLQLFRHWSSSFRMIVANSGHMQRRLAQWGCRAASVIPCAVEARPQRPPLAGPPLAAFAGRLIPEKGAHVLIEAFRGFPDARLLIAGDGPSRAALQRMAGPNVEFTGHLSRAAMEVRFAQAWVQVVPSTWEEPFGLTAAEAQMRGTAVIASAAGGLPEVVMDGQTGLLVPPADPGALARALNRLFTDRPLAEAMGGAGRESAQARFSMESFATQFLEAYESIMG